MSSFEDILVIGKGHLGSYLANRWNSRYQWKDPMVDITLRDLQLLKPSAIVIAAGKTDLHWCEENPSACRFHNVGSPLAVCTVAKRYKSTLPIFHLSTGCAWQGPYREDGRPFGPYDKPEPVCEYTKSKVECDELLLKEFKQVTILRPRLLYSDNYFSNRNTLMKINSYPKLIDTPNSMTSTRTVAKTIERLPFSFCSEKSKIVNVYERGVISPYHVGCLLHIMGLRKHPEKITKSDLDSYHKPKRADVVLYDKAFEHYVNPPYVTQELLSMIKMGGPPSW